MQTVIYEVRTGRVVSTAGLRSLTSGDRLMINRTHYRVMSSRHTGLVDGQGQREIFVSAID